jgi:hypothetical protein
MKRIFLLPLTFCLLTACEREPAVTTVEIPGYVYVEVAAEENEAPKLPSQISVKFEKPIKEDEHLSLSVLEPLFTQLLYSENADTLYFGCNEFQGHVLPDNLEASHVVLCGKIGVPSNGFKMRVTNLELRNAVLTNIPQEIANETDPESFPTLMISTANLTVIGENKIVLQGYAKGSERQMSPTLYLLLGETEGPGKLEIYSRSSVKHLKY